MFDTLKMIHLILLCLKVPHEIVIKCDFTKYLKEVVGYVLNNIFIFRYFPFCLCLQDFIKILSGTAVSFNGLTWG